jgi:hypothetical protein
LLPASEHCRAAMWLHACMRCPPVGDVLAGCAQQGRRQHAMTLLRHARTWTCEGSSCHPSSTIRLTAQQLLLQVQLHGTAASPASPHPPTLMSLVMLYTLPRNDTQQSCGVVWQATCSTRGTSMGLLSSALCPQKAGRGRALPPAGPIYLLRRVVPPQLGLHHLRAYSWSIRGLWHACWHRATPQRAPRRAPAPVRTRARARRCGPDCTQRITLVSK